MMSQLMTRVDKLEATNFKQVDRVGDRADQPAKSGTGDASCNQRVVVCFRRREEQRRGKIFEARVLRERWTHGQGVWGAQPPKMLSKIEHMRSLEILLL